MNAMKFKILSIIILLISHSAISSPLQSYSEEHSAAQITAPTGLLNFVLQSEPSDLENFEDCLKNNNISKNDLSKLFIVSYANINSSYKNIYFVRPAIEPFCLTFYGAHLFRYWFVKANSLGSKPSFELLFKAGGDGISVLDSETNGYKDLESESHTAIEIYRLQLKYDGKKYKNAKCTVENIETKTLKLCN